LVIDLAGGRGLLDVPFSPDLVMLYPINVLSRYLYPERSQMGPHNSTVYNLLMNPEVLDLGERAEKVAEKRKAESVEGWWGGRRQETFRIFSVMSVKFFSM